MIACSQNAIDVCRTWEILENEFFAPGYMYSRSVACGKVCEWVLSIVELHDLLSGPPSTWQSVYGYTAGDDCPLAWYAGVTTYKPNATELFGRVEKLDLRHNGLSGALAGAMSQLAALAALVRLYLSDNRLSGTIPPELAEMRSLRRLELHNNLLVGSVPAALAGLGLEWFNVSRNQLSSANGAFMLEDTARIKEVCNVDCTTELQGYSEAAVASLFTTLKAIDACAADSASV